MNLFFAILMWLITPYQHATISCDTFSGHAQADVSAPASDLALEMNIMRNKLGCK
jgi:hypothetical protein